MSLFRSKRLWLLAGLNISNRTPICPVPPPGSYPEINQQAKAGTIPILAEEWKRLPSLAKFWRPFILFCNNRTCAGRVLCHFIIKDHSEKQNRGKKLRRFKKDRHA
jgi:hypothetical protein